MLPVPSELYCSLRLHHCPCLQGKTRKDAVKSKLGVKVGGVGKKKARCAARALPPGASWDSGWCGLGCNSWVQTQPAGFGTLSWCSAAFLGTLSYSQLTAACRQRAHLTALHSTFSSPERPALLSRPYAACSS